MDSRDLEKKSAAIIEKVGPKTLEMGQDFSFFSNPVPSENSEIIEAADVKNNRGLIGRLIGRASRLNNKPIKGNDALALTFEIRANAEKSPSSPIEGFPFQEPVIYVSLFDGKKYASLGTPSGENLKSIQFNNWIEIQKESKNTVRQTFKSFRPQPREFRLHELVEARYKIT